MHGYLIDANLPRWFKPWSGVGFHFANDFGKDWSDSGLWDYAVAHGLTIVTRDADYAERALGTRSGPRIIHLRTGNLTMADYHIVLAPIWRPICQESAGHRIVEVYRDRLECIGSSDKDHPE